MQDLLFSHQEGHGEGQLSIFGQPPAALLPLELWLWLGGSGSCERSLLSSRLCPLSPNPSSDLQILAWLPLLPCPARRDNHSAGFDFGKELLEPCEVRENFEGESQKVLKKCTFSEDNKNGK